MFTKEHYTFMADVIVNDSNLPFELKQLMFAFWGVHFKRSFEDFDIQKWNKVWTDRFQFPLASPEESRSSESSETKLTKPG